MEKCRFWRQVSDDGAHLQFNLINYFRSRKLLRRLSAFLQRFYVRVDMPLIQMYQRYSINSHFTWRKYETWICNLLEKFFRPTFYASWLMKIYWPVAISRNSIYRIDTCIASPHTPFADQSVCTQKPVFIILLQYQHSHCVQRWPSVSSLLRLIAGLNMKSICHSRFFCSAPFWCVSIRLVIRNVLWFGATER